ncbi:DUF6776 family protein [Pseudoxanthomonas sp. JBR18]|uniref:DUF6776 family protein n=1 Tax=Pseudoxanthomonas sp. JBR18 TaxID=2969308 RepID=UPI002304FDC2|nr:DUF6776 family protein [Pseudoxanthomonas sp. JBR18]WCE02769.1 hypothetical protein PJ250_11490 [Pseudoxanthomonas sp. JBR18]
MSPSEPAGPPPSPEGPHLLPISRGARALVIGLGAAMLVALAFGAWGAWIVFSPAASALPTPAEWRAAQAHARDLEQQVATLSRSDQISREANRDLQDTLGERDEQIAGLRADVAFYERFVGSTAQRRGLAVHQLTLVPQTDQAWHFTATLTQNLNRGAVNRGRLQLVVEGTHDGKLETLDWPRLRQQPGADGMAYSFKYFQQLEGEVVLPPAFKPLRVTARLQPDDGSRVDQSFTWTEATEPGPADVPEPTAVAG